MARLVMPAFLLAWSVPASVQAQRKPDRAADWCAWHTHDTCRALTRATTTGCAPNNESTICRNTAYAYKTVLGREPDPREFERWKKALANVPGFGQDLSVAPIMTALIKELQSDSKMRRNLIEWGVLRRVFYGAGAARAPAPPKERIDEIEAEMVAEKLTFADVERIALTAQRQAINIYMGSLPASIGGCAIVVEAIEATRQTELPEILARRLQEPIVVRPGRERQVLVRLQSRMKEVDWTPAIKAAVARCYAPSVASQVLPLVYADEDSSVGYKLRPVLLDPNGVPMRAAIDAVVASFTKLKKPTGSGRGRFNDFEVGGPVTRRSGQIISPEQVLRDELFEKLKANKTGFPGFKAIFGELDKLRRLYAGQVIASLFPIVRQNFPTVLGAAVHPNGRVVQAAADWIRTSPPGKWEQDIRGNWSRQSELIRALTETGLDVFKRERLCVNERYEVLYAAIKRQFPKFGFNKDPNQVAVALSKCIDGLEIVNALDLAYFHYTKVEPGLRAIFKDPSSDLLKTALAKTSNVKLTPADWQIISSRDQRRIPQSRNLANFIAPLLEKPVSDKVEAEYVRLREETVRSSLLTVFKDAITCSPQIIPAVTSSGNPFFKALLRRFSSTERLDAANVRAKLTQEQGSLLDKLKVGSPNRDAAIAALRREFATELDHYPSIAGMLLFDDASDPSRASPLRTVIKEMWGWCKGANDPAKLEKSVREKRGYFLSQLGIGAELERLKGEAVKSLIFVATAELRANYPGIAGYLMNPTLPEHPSGTRPNRALTLMRKLLDDGVGGGGPQGLRNHFATADARRKFVSESNLDSTAGTVLWMKENACISQGLAKFRAVFEPPFSRFPFEKASDFGKWVENGQGEFAKTIEALGKHVLTQFSKKDGPCAGAMVSPVTVVLNTVYSSARQIVTNLVEAKTKEFDETAARLNDCHDVAKGTLWFSFEIIRIDVETAMRHLGSGNRKDADDTLSQISSRCKGSGRGDFLPSLSFPKNLTAKEKNCTGFEQIRSLLADGDKRYDDFCANAQEALTKASKAADDRRRALEEQARREADAKAPPWEKFGKWVGKVSNGVGQMFSDPQAAMSTFNSAMSDVMVEGGSLAKGIGDGFAKVGEFTTAGLQAMGQAAVGAVTYVVDLGKNAIDFVGNSAKALWDQYGVPIAEGVKRAISDAFDTIVSPVLDQIYSAVTGPVGRLITALGQNAIDCLAGQTKVSAIEPVCGLVPPRVRVVFKDVKDFFTGAGKILDIVSSLAKIVETVTGLCPDPFAAMTSPGGKTQAIADAVNKLIDALLDQAAIMLRPALVGIVSGFVEAVLKLPVVTKTIYPPLVAMITQAVAAAGATLGGVGALLGPVAGVLSHFALNALHDTFLAPLIAEKVSDFVFDGTAIPVVNIRIPGAKELVRNFVLKPLLNQSFDALRPVLSEPLKALCKGVGAVIPLDKLRDAARKLGAITEQKEYGPGDLILAAVQRLADFAEKESNRFGDGIKFLGDVFGAWGLGMPPDLMTFAGKIATESGRRFGVELRLSCGNKQLKGGDVAALAKEVFDCIGPVALNALQESTIVSAVAEIAKGATSKSGLDAAWGAFVGSFGGFKLSFPALPGKLDELLKSGLDAGAAVFGRFVGQVCSSVTRDIGKGEGIKKFLENLFNCLGVGAQIGLAAGALDAFSGLGFGAIKGGLSSLFGALGRAIPGDFNVAAMLDKASGAAVEKFGLQIRAACVNLAFEGNDWRGAFDRFVTGVVACLRREAESALIVGRNALVKEALMKVVDAARGEGETFRLQFANLAGFFENAGLNFSLNFGGAGSVNLPDMLKGVGANIGRYGIPAMSQCLESCIGADGSKLNIGANVDWGALVSQAGSCAGTALAAAAYDGTVRWIANEARSGTLKGAVVDNIEKLASAVKLGFPKDLRDKVATLTDTGFSTFANELESNPKCKPSCGGSANFSGMLKNATECLAESLNAAAGEALKVFACSEYRKALNRTISSADDGLKAVDAFFGDARMRGVPGVSDLKSAIGKVASAGRDTFVRKASDCCENNLTRNVGATFGAVVKCTSVAAEDAVKAAGAAAQGPAATSQSPVVDPAGKWQGNANNHRFDLEIARAGSGYQLDLRFGGAGRENIDSVSFDPATRVLELRRVSPGWWQWYRLTVSANSLEGRFSNLQQAQKPNLSEFKYGVTAQRAGWPSGFASRLVRDVVPAIAGPHENPVGRQFIYRSNLEPIKNLLPEMEGSVLIQGGYGVPPVFTLTEPAIVYHTDAYDHTKCQPPGGGWTKVGTIYRASDNHPWGVYRKRVPAGRFEAARCSNNTAVFVKRIP